MSLLLPRYIVVKRINNSLERFYSTLSLFCNTLGVLCTRPINESYFSIDEEDYNIKWSNNLSHVQIVNKFTSNRPKEILFEYFIPSFTDRPRFNRDFQVINSDDIISYHHKVSVMLPEEYPAKVDEISITAVSKLWHPHFNLKGLFLINLNCEIDIIGIHLFQQLLWDHSHIAINENIYDVERNDIESKRIKLSNNKFNHTFLLEKLLKTNDLVQI